MLKRNLVVLMAVVLVLSFASMAMAAQLTSVVNGIYPTTDKTYQATPKLPTVGGSAYTNYPYGIYLPNAVNPAAYRIHSNYTKNTDACAACHATHTAVGNSLLQWYTVYDTCMACHDGTVTTTYDVQDGVIGTTGKASFGGMFGTGTEGSLSNHNVRGGLEIAAAPGGSTVGETVNKASGSGTATKWTTEFGCESCHTPHGQGGNARILNPDPNFVATQNKKTGLALTQIDSVTYAAYPAGDATKTPYTMIKGYPYSKTTFVYVNGTKTTVTYDNALGYTLVKFGTAPVGAVTADFYPAVRVAMTISNYLATNESVTHKSGMNNFCGACHTDYNTEGFVNAETGAVNSGSAEAETGTYSKAHRHQVGFYYGYSAGKLAAANMVLENGNMECLTCHVAHGTSTDYWTRTVGSTSTTAGRLASAYLTDDTLSELAGSSALKRLPNMGTCEACHAKGDGNDGYSANTGQAAVTGTANVLNTLNYNANLFARAFRFVNDDATIPATLSVDTKYSNVKNASDSNRYFYEYLLDGSGSGVFANEKYVGSDKCASCHKEYYDGWEKSHAESFIPVSEKPEIAAEFAKFAGQTNVAASSLVEDNTKALWNTRVAYTVGSYTATSMTWTSASVGNEVYTTNLSDIDFVWMNHYLVKTIDASKGIYKRVATWDENAPAGEPKLKPMFNRGTALPDNTSYASWWQSVDATGTTSSGNAAEGCLSCHAPQMQNALGTPDKTIGCESCHGPASRHIAAPSSVNILNPQTKLNFAQQQGLCLTCHSGKHNALSTYKSSKHYSTAGVGCTTCHDVHNTVKGDGQHSSLVVSETNKNQLCASCHDTVINVDTYMKTGVEAAKSGTTDPTMWTRHGFDAVIK